MSPKLTLAVMIDALRYDYVDTAQPDFLSSVKARGVSTTVREVFGFQTRPAFFAGLYPETSDIAHLFTYEPDDTPFVEAGLIPRSVRRRIDDSRLKNPARATFDRLARRRERRRGHDASEHIVYSANVPLDLLDYFAISEKYSIQSGQGLPGRTLFEVLDEEGMEWLWVAYPTANQTTEGIEREYFERIDTSHRFAFLHYAELDWAGHEHGPASEECFARLEEIDASIERIYEHATDIFDEVDLVVFGDHGMVPVDEAIDVEAHLQGLDADPVADYVYFLDSNQARFWFSSSEAEREIRSMLEGLEGGRILTDGDLDSIRATLTDRYGEVIFLADPGYVVAPNFFQEDTVAGMHGYHPDTQDNHTELIIDDPHDEHTPIEDDIVDLVSVFPTLLRLMDLPVPSSNEGDPVIE